MSRGTALAALTAAFVMTAGVAASAQEVAAAKAPDPAQVRRAAEAFDAGVAAFKDRQFELAASRFEEADAAIPSPQALRQAIRARQEAGQGSRAASLAALALQRYPADEQTRTLAGEVIEQLTPLLHKVSVSCAPPCVLAAGTRAIHGQATTRWVVYLDPQPTTLGASFLGGASKQVDIDAKAGGGSEIRLEPGDAAASGAAPAPGSASAPAPGSATGAAPAPGSASAPAPAPAPGSASAPGPAPGAASASAPAPDAGQAQASGGGIPRWVFFGGVAATAALGGVTIWSGIDTLNNPGADAVRAGCAGQGPDCPLYQDGLARETRTNALLFITAGAGALTLAAALFTDWGGGAAPEAGKRRVAPVVVATGRGGFLGAEGTF